MSTRAAAASKSRLAKQRLLNVLFGEKRSKVVNNGKELRSNNDYASFSYNDIRRAYLERIQDIHPDKYLHSNRRNDNKTYRCINKIGTASCSKISPKDHSQVSGTGKEEKVMQEKMMSSLKNEFIELQEAWINYENVTKDIKKVGEIDANFTMFGVGCSFSDSPEETLRRSEIMDQAGRGWFTAGLISESDTTNLKPQSRKTNEQISLTDDDLFVNSNEGGITSNNQNDENDKACPKPKSLIDHSFLKGIKKN